MTTSNPAPGGAPADTILANGRIATQDGWRSFVDALAIKDGHIYATGDAATVMAYRGPSTRVIELSGRTVIPGLTDSHSHPIRGASITTWNCDGTACRRWPMPCACCASRRNVRRPISGFA